MSFLLACSGEDESSIPSEPEIIMQPPTEENEEGSSGEGNETQTLNLVIEGLDLNFENLEAVSISGNSNLKEDGSFQELESELGIPVILTGENEDLLFGYYPSLLNSEEITDKDLIVFFINTYPDFAIQNYDLKDLVNELANVDYNNLKGEMIHSLNAYNNPYYNSNFLSELRNLTSELKARLTDIEANRSSETDDEFEIEYTRDNKISFPKKSPLYVSIGVGFEHDIENEVYSEYLTPKLTSDFRKSIADKIEEFLYGEEEQTELAFQGSLVHDGEWGVRITNGRHGDSRLAVDTRHQNTKQLNALILSYCLPVVFEIFDLNGPCGDGFIEIAEDLLSQLRSKLEDPNINFDAKFYEETLKGESENLFQMYEACLSPENKKLAYVKVFKKWVGKIFNIITFSEDLGQLILIDRDFTSSIIDQYGTLYLEKEQNLLFSILEYQNVSDTSFEGNTGDIFNYEAIVKEYWQKYEIKSTSVRSEFIKKPIERPGDQLPFKVGKVSGDASYNDGAITNDQGELKLNFELKEESSEFKIESHLQNSTLPEQNLKIEVQNGERNLLDGYWELCWDTIESFSDGCSSVDAGNCWRYGKVRFLDNNELDFPINYGTPSEDVVESSYNLTENHLYFIRKTEYEGTSSTTDPNTGETIKSFIKREQSFEGEIISEGLIKGVYKYQTYVTYSSYYSDTSCTYIYNSTLSK
ncbi:hypothetical protein [Christiangramia sp. SM2212]|uniref:Lipoprotein n=1 Tax=Christiangramia sediminicola TaxID=3073267 RepID=A0ABU1EQ30_9FLAO|nr:hypothetical protein [Christiangramia sp. SM2212]MDR5590495.1 hypothetical protein [Christiangramia sp. SM2212]